MLLTELPTYYFLFIRFVICWTEGQERVGQELQNVFTINLISKSQIDKVDFFKMDNSRPLFRLFSSFQPNITNKCENLHPVYGAGIRTQDLRNMSLLP